MRTRGIAVGLSLANFAELYEGHDLLDSLLVRERFDPRRERGGGSRQCRRPCPTVIGVVSQFPFLRVWRIHPTVLEVKVFFHLSHHAVPDIAMPREVLIEIVGRGSDRRRKVFLQYATLIGATPQ